MTQMSNSTMHDEMIIVGDDEIITAGEPNNLQVEMQQIVTDNQPVKIVEKNDDISFAKEKQEDTTKSTVIAYKILIHLLLLYAVIGVTYLLIISINADTCKCSNNNSFNVNESSTTSTTTTTAPYITTTKSAMTTIAATTTTGTASPSMLPSLIPTSIPSSIPTSIPTETPTESPLDAQTIPSPQPTSPPTYYKIYDHFVGDYKISALNYSHGNWLLCDGSEVNSTDYPLLFTAIGTSFGIGSNEFMFRLPNAKNNVMGIVSNVNNHFLGDIVGQEIVNLNESNMPSHSHYLVADVSCVQTLTTEQYLASSCMQTTYTGDGQRFYEFAGTSVEPNAVPTGSVGNGESFAILQPTLYAGDLFIYAL